jgi:hypothetical protein
LLFGFLGEGGEPVDLVSPERLEEGLQGAEPVVVGAVEALLAGLADADEAGFAEECEMLRDAGVTELEPRHELADRELFPPHLTEDRLTARLGDELQRIHTFILPTDEMVLRLRRYENEMEVGMTDVLFRFDIDAVPEVALEALKTTDGIKGFWTSRAEVPAEVGSTVKVEFAIAPLPFDLLLEQSDEKTVVWRPQTFPPHWVGTTIRWDVEPREGGATVSFRHVGFSDEAEAGGVAFTWGQIMVRLKQYAETGNTNPVFA